MQSIEHIEVQKIQKIDQITNQVKNQSRPIIDNISQDMWLKISNFQNPVQRILYLLFQIRVLTDQDIEYFQQSFIREFLQMNQRNLLDDEMTILLSKIMDFQNVRQNQMNVQDQSNQNHQEQQQQNQKDQLINEMIQTRSCISQNNLVSLNSEQASNNKKSTCLRNHQLTPISEQAHSIFLVFLDESMQNLKVKTMIVQFCMKHQIWLFRHGAVNFLRRIIVINAFFPYLYLPIIRQFSTIIAEFMKQKVMGQHLSYAKQILAHKYLMSLKKYSQTNDILEAAKCIYTKNNNKLIKQIINRLDDFQKTIKVKLQSRKRQIYLYFQSKNQIYLDTQYPKFKSNTLKKKSTTKYIKKKMLNKISMKGHCDWNPIHRPKYFKLQILQVYSQQNNRKQSQSQNFV